MITDKVITEIYRRYKKPNKNEKELNLEYFIELLKNHHDISVNNGEVIIGSLEEFNPFRRFLVRSLHGVLEFDKMVAFVFRNHIVFLSKESDDMRIHLRPEEKKGLLSRLFGK